MPRIAKEKKQNAVNGMSNSISKVVNSKINDKISFNHAQSINELV